MPFPLSLLCFHALWPATWYVDLELILLIAANDTCPLGMRILDCKNPIHTWEQAPLEMAGFAPEKTWIGLWYSCVLLGFKFYVSGRVLNLCQRWAGDVGEGACAFKREMKANIFGVLNWIWNTHMFLDAFWREPLPVSVDHSALIPHKESCLNSWPWGLESCFILKGTLAQWQSIGYAYRRCQV